MRKTIVISMPSPGQILVKDYAVDISIQANDEVTWGGNPANLDWVVCFGEESPFQQKHFFKGRKDSGPIKVAVTSDKYFKYTVEVDGHTLDPGIIVRP
jgi:hypothetical protein